MIFERLEIKLKGPICNCDKTALVWAIPKDKQGKSELRVACAICGTVMVVPHHKFVARFVLETPYPDGGGTASKIEVVNPNRPDFSSPLAQHCKLTEPCVDDVYCNCSCDKCDKTECVRPGCMERVEDGASLCGKRHLRSYSPS